MKNCCLTLLCPPVHEEKLLDLLLMAPDATIFTSATVATHGLPSASMEAAEQVLGRARSTQVQVLLDSAGKEALLSEIRAQFPGGRLLYWVTPVAESGVLP